MQDRAMPDPDRAAVAIAVPGRARDAARGGRPLPGLDVDGQDADRLGVELGVQIDWVGAASRA
jgi:hypothetical protein